MCGFSGCANDKTSGSMSGGQGALGNPNQCVWLATSATPGKREPPTCSPRSGHLSYILKHPWNIMEGALHLHRAVLQDLRHPSQIISNMKELQLRSQYHLENSYTPTTNIRKKHSPKGKRWHVDGKNILPASIPIAMVIPSTPDVVFRSARMCQRVHVICHRIDQCLVDSVETMVGTHTHTRHYSTHDIVIDDDLCPVFWSVNESFEIACPHHLTFLPFFRIGEVFGYT